MAPFWLREGARSYTARRSAKRTSKQGQIFILETPSNIGSVTKQFTATSIMILEERKKLSYDDPVSKYISEFSRAAHFSKITLRQLLTHTSGMPDYGDLGIDDSVLDQRGLIAALLNKEGSFAAPGLKYRYSNPGYALLAIVVERVSGEHFGEFLEQEIFQPAGISRTFLYDTPKKKTRQVRPGLRSIWRDRRRRTNSNPGRRRHLFDRG